MLKTEAQKKTEKLASAAYLITGYFDDKEPLKWKLRNLASELVSISLFVKDNVYLTEETYMSELQSVVSELSSHFQVARAAGLVSEMNHGILSKEFDKFIESLNSKDVHEAPVSRFNAPVLSENFFDTGSRRVELPEHKEVREEIKDKTSDDRPVRELPKPAERPQVHTEPRRGEEQKERSLKEFGAVAVKKNSRQSVIINLLKRKREIMIKDVTPLIEGVSEKTIQRELLAMVKEGILKKEGEKRWSRYTLA